MTVVLGLSCADGLVLAADSQVTRGAGVASVKFVDMKIQAVGDNIVYAAAGSLPLQQWIDQALQSDAKNLSACKRQAVPERLRRVLVPILQKSFNDYIPFDNTEPDMWTAVFCGRAPDGLWMLTVHPGGQIEAADPTSVGSGFAAGAIALAGVQHYNLGGLGIERAKAVAYRATFHVCTVSGAGVGLPIRLATVTASGGAAILTPGEMTAIGETVDLWKSREVEILGSLAIDSRGEAGGDDVLDVGAS
jgi:20S proteasome alpha/beta subunit